MVGLVSGKSKECCLKRFLRSQLREEACFPVSKQGTHWSISSLTIQKFGDWILLIPQYSKQLTLIFQQTLDTQTSWNQMNKKKANFLRIKWWWKWNLAIGGAVVFNDPSSFGAESLEDFVVIAVFGKTIVALSPEASVNLSSDGSPPPLSPHIVLPFLPRRLPPRRRRPLRRHFSDAQVAVACVAGDLTPTTKGEAGEVGYEANALVRCMCSPWEMLPRGEAHNRLLRLSLRDSSSMHTSRQVKSSAWFEVDLSITCSCLRGIQFIRLSTSTPSNVNN